MTVFRLGRAGLGEIRFGASALVDVLGAARLAFDPNAGGGTHRPWWCEAHAAVSRSKFPLLDEIMCPGRYVPDIVVGKPGPRPSLEADLHALAALPPDEVRRIFVFAYGDDIPDRLRRAVDRPLDLVTQLSRELRRFAALVLSGSRWPALRGLAAAEAWERGLALASGGARAALEVPIRGVHLRGTAIVVEDGTAVTVDPEREGFWFVPSAFAPTMPSAGRDPRAFAGLTYRPAGVAAAIAASLPGDPLTALAGSARARLLRALLVPRSTKELSEELELAASTVSQQLGRLKAGGLVTSRRQGRTVVYSLSAHTRGLAVGWPGQVPDHEPSQLGELPD